MFAMTDLAVPDDCLLHELEQRLRCGLTANPGVPVLCTLGDFLPWLARRAGLAGGRLDAAALDARLQGDRTRGHADALLVCTLQHLRLHHSSGLAAPTYQRRRTEALAWVRQALTSWRRELDGRFGPIHCIEWGPGQRYCVRLGYVFDQTPYPIEHLGERLAHRDRVWQAVARTDARPLLESLKVWQALGSDHSLAGDPQEQQWLQCPRQASPVQGNGIPASSTA